LHLAVAAIVIVVVVIVAALFLTTSVFKPGGSGSHPLAITASANRTSGPAPLFVGFTADATGGTGSYRCFNWDFGDGQDGTGTSVSHEYITAGTYSAHATVTDSSGDTATSNVVSITVSSSVTMGSSTGSECSSRGL
jgi:PKD repeat protein